MDVYLSASGNPLKKGEDVAGSSYRIFDLDRNLFIGVDNLLTSGTYGCSYRAAEDSVLYTYPAPTQEQAWSVIQTQKDYGTFILQSLHALITKSCAAHRKLRAVTRHLRIITDNLSIFFWVLKDFNGFNHAASSEFLQEGMDRLEIIQGDGQLVPFFDAAWLETDRTGDEEDATACRSPFLQDKLTYFAHLNNIPIDTRKSFFAADPFVTSRHCTEETECLEDILSHLREEFTRLEESLAKLYTDHGECLYTVYAKAAFELAKGSKDPTHVLSTLDYILGEIKHVTSLLKSEYGHESQLDLEYLEHAHQNLMASINNKVENLSSGEVSAVMSTANHNSLPEELKDSAIKILEFSGLPKEKTQPFLMNLLAFRNMEDRFSTDDGARKVRSSAATDFFPIYEAVFNKAAETKDNSRLIQMFLTFGYMDEWLLTPEQVLQLYRLAGRDPAPDNGTVVSIREWLTEIRELRKEPSRNEFETDYADTFRELKRANRITDKEKPAYDANYAAKVSFEVQNMVRINQKLTHGKPLVYFPVLHQEMLTRDLDSAVITPAKIKASLDRVLAIDFSAFHREVHFTDPKHNIEKETVMKEIIPDIILMPTFGSRAMMWQEITGRARNTPGRFLLPAFTDEDLDTMMLRLVGNFRWELCRTMMGTAWNDVTVPSLTSEYSDYIQFYKNNSDLPTDAKDKLRLQIAKYSNRTRDIFTSDYEGWIRSESKGNLRLNRIARGIFYKYCPFPRETREMLSKQPLYAVFARLFERAREKEAKTLTGRYLKLARGGELHPDLAYNLKFFKEL